MFSFNSPQGMCQTCDGLGELFTFDPDLLISDPGKSFQQGCFELLGNWKDLGRWKRHIYQGVADCYEKENNLEAGTMLETAWEELPEEIQDAWLYGTGNLNITYTWKGGASPMKYGGVFAGITAELDERYHKTTGAAKIRKLEAYMNEVDCVNCHGERLNEQARHFRMQTKRPQVRQEAKPIACPKSAISPSPKRLISFQKWNSNQQEPLLLSNRSRKFAIVWASY